MNARISRIGLLASSAIAAATLVACGGGGGDSTPAPAPATTMGTLAVSMTDAPACGFDAVNVTVSKVRVNKSATASETDAGWTDITLNPARKINLLNLTNGALDALGQTPLEAGHYTQLRLVLDAGANANTVVKSGTTAEIALTTPSGTQSGLKLGHEFDVAAGQKVDLVLDFDACKSIVTAGNGKYLLKPVIKVIPTAINGIAGVIAPALLGKHVVVSAQQNGVIVSSTTPDATKGEFFLARMPAGNYDVVITADDSAAAVVSTVPVTASATTSLSTAATPITLAASTMASIGGTALLVPASATEAVYLAARQSFAAGPTVTVKYQGADMATGAYTIANLPVAAPQYAAYSATLPLVFAANTSTTPGTGKYSVEASATGYKAQTNASVDVSAANAAAVNFSLVP